MDDPANHTDLGITFRKMEGSEFPRFRPHRALRNAHAQTIGGVYFPGRLAPYRATPREVLLDDGDVIVMHEDRPHAWCRGDRVVLMLHGLGGSHKSPYLVRIAAKLNARGIRTFRQDLRGYGMGSLKAKGFGHAGKSEDMSPVIDYIADLCPGSPLTVIGFSKGGNILLKYLGEMAGNTPPNLDGALAVAPPIDLFHCGRNLRQGVNRIYDVSFMRCLRQLVLRRHRRIPGMEDVPVSPLPGRLWEFDDQYTAPMIGYSGVEEYYRKASSAPLLKDIRLPTQIVVAKDDPLVPIDMFDRYEMSNSIKLHLTDHGGHIGYIGEAGLDPDRRWLDWRIVEWITQCEQRRNEAKDASREVIAV